MFTDLEVVDQGLRKSVKKLTKSFLLWNMLFKRTVPGPKIVVERKNRVPTLTMFHDQIGHWHAEKTRQFNTERFWWSSVGFNVVLSFGVATVARNLSQFLSIVPP